MTTTISLLLLQLGQRRCKKNNETTTHINMSIWNIGINIIISIIDLNIINFEQFYHMTKSIQIYPAYPTLSQLSHSMPFIPFCSTHPTIHHLSRTTSPVQFYSTRSTLPHSFRSTLPITLYPTRFALPHPFRSTRSISL